eukprot:m.316324 g.316324  ORF g.316324 m.316324 type:complete len:56 (+) comp16502_c0_seq8:501-668(+)
MRLAGSLRTTTKDTLNSINVRCSDQSSSCAFVAQAVYFELPKQFISLNSLSLLAC